MERIVLAYTGGLHTSIAVPWLAETHGAEVITLTLDLGQGRELGPIRDRALLAGAVNAHVLDARGEFVSGHVLPALQAGVMGEGRSPLAGALARPLIAKTLVEMARIEGAHSIAHGSRGTDHGPDPLGVAIRALDPAIRVVAPAREWGMDAAGAIAYARQRGIPVPATQARPRGGEANLWGRRIVIDGSCDHPPAGAYTLTTDPATCPDEPASLEIEFLRGVPVAVNGVPMSLVEVIDSVSTIAGHHGVGRIDTVTRDSAGNLSREIREAPAAVVLDAAHKDLEGLVSPPALCRIKLGLAREYADLVRSGHWFSSVRRAIDAFVADGQQHVTGTISLTLFKGAYRVVGRTSASALGDPRLVTPGDGGALAQSAEVSR